MLLDVLLAVLRVYIFHFFRVSSLLVGNDYYTECYPGMAEMQDAIDDSDDEADYTKMDMVGRLGRSIEQALVKKH